MNPKSKFYKNKVFCYITNAESFIKLGATICTATVLAGMLASTFSIEPFDSFGQSGLTTSLDQVSNVSSLTARLGELLFVEHGRITGQRVLAVDPHPQLETSFMAKTSINNGTGFVVNANNIGTIISTLNDDGHLAVRVRVY